VFIIIRSFVKATDLNGIDDFRVRQIDERKTGGAIPVVAIEKITAPKITLPHNLFAVKHPQNQSPTIGTFYYHVRRFDDLGFRRK